MSICFIINLQLYKDSIIGAYTLFRDSILFADFCLIWLEKLPCCLIILLCKSSKYELLQRISSTYLITSAPLIEASSFSNNLLTESTFFRKPHCVIKRLVNNSLNYNGFPVLFQIFKEEKDSVAHILRISSRKMIGVYRLTQ